MPELKYKQFPTTMIKCGIKEFIFKISSEKKLF